MYLGAVQLGTGAVLPLAPLSLPYSPEFEPRQDPEEGQKTLSEMARVTGGLERTAWNDVFDASRLRNRQVRDLVIPLTLMLLALHMIEIAGRRLLLFAAAQEWLRTVRFPRVRLTRRSPQSEGGRSRAKAASPRRRARLRLMRPRPPHPRNLPRPRWRAPKRRRATGWGIEMAYDPRHMLGGPGKVAITAGMAGVLAGAGFVFTLEAQQAQSRPPVAAVTAPAPQRSLVDEYCVSCHDADKKKADLALDTIAAQDVRAASGRVGESRPQAPRAPDAADWQGAARRGDLRRGDRVARGVARSCRRGASESRPHRHAPPADAHRIPERHPRSPRGRDRCRVAAAGR